MNEPVTISRDEIVKAKRAIVVLFDVFKQAYGDSDPPATFTDDCETLVALIRKVEALCKGEQ